ncbi:zinc-binding dehydrogenase [Rhodococcus pyridinivorans]
MQLAKLFGAWVIAATSNETKAERRRELGADTVLNYQEHPEWDRLVLDATAGRGVDRAVETVGPQTLERSIRSTTFGGELAHVGGGGFSDPAGQTFDPRVLHGQSLTLRRITVGSRRAFEQVNRAITMHQLRPVIDRIIPFEDATAPTTGFRPEHTSARLSSRSADTVLWTATAHQQSRAESPGRRQTVRGDLVQHPEETLGANHGEKRSSPGRWCATLSRDSSSLVQAVNAGVTSSAGSVTVSADGLLRRDRARTSGPR